MGEPVRIVEWYRADNSRRMRRVLVTGAASLSLGGLVIAVSFLTRQPERVREYAAGLGLVLVAGSALFTAVSMPRILREDVSVVLRNDGIGVHAGAHETFVAWADLGGARWDEGRGALLLERRAGDALVVGWRPARITGPALAARIERERQRAALGLMR